MVDINESGNKRMDADNSKKLKIKKKRVNVRELTKSVAA